MNLKKIVPAPKYPQHNGSPKDWGVVERILDFQLPDDYKKLINLYGAGCFVNFIYPLSPFAPFRVSFNLLSGTTKQTLNSYESGQKEFPEFSPPFPVYPHKPGLFPWAITTNGGTLFWLMNGKPDSWPVINCDSKFTENYERFNLNATNFLVQVMRGVIKSKIFPKDILSRGPTFTPYIDEDSI
jgi:hypothetical protein